MRQWHAAVLRASFCHFCKRHVGAGRRKHFRNAKTGIIVGAAEFLQGGLTSPEGRNVSRSVPVSHRSSKPPTHGRSAQPRSSQHCPSSSNGILGEHKFEYASCNEAAVFAQLDTNGDGDVSLQEFHAAKASLDLGRSRA